MDLIDRAVNVRFEPTRLGDLGMGEDACLGIVDDRLMTVLVRLNGSAPDDEAWYLQTGFGRCEWEGVIFPTLVAAEAWMIERLTKS